MMTRNNKQSALQSLYTRLSETLSAMANDVSAPLGDYMNPVFGDGDIDSRLMMIGEAPGAFEAKEGRPFVGKAGKQLDELFQNAQIDRRGVFVTNTVKYRPTKQSTRTVSNRTPTTAEIEHGILTLKEEIAIVVPKVVATLGNTPLKAMIAILNQSRMTIGDVHARAIRGSFDGIDIILFPLYHPASAIYNRTLVETMKEDIIKLSELLNEEGECIDV